jgi:hypothetical protein
VVVGRRGSHLRTFCVEEKRARFGSGRRSSNPAGIGDSRGGHAEYLVGNDVVVGRRGSHLGHSGSGPQDRGHMLSTITCVLQVVLDSFKECFVMLDML